MDWFLRVLAIIWVRLSRHKADLHYIAQLEAQLLLLDREKEHLLDPSKSSTEMLADAQGELAFAWLAVTMNKLRAGGLAQNAIQCKKDAAARGLYSAKAVDTGQPAFEVFLRDNKAVIKDFEDLDRW